MKKILLVSTAMFIAIFAFVACNNDDSSIESKVQTKKSITSKLGAYREIAQYHSKGLEYTYENLIGPNKTRTDVDLIETSDDEKTKLICTITNEYMQTVSIPDEFTTRTESNSNKELIPFEEMRPEINEFIEYIDNNLFDKSSGRTISENVDMLVSDLEQNDFFNSISEFDQQAFMLYIVTFEDSYKYWAEHVDKWPAGAESTRGIGDWWNRNKRLVKADAYGGLCFGAGGALVGGVKGAIAGTAFAGIGAAGGFIVGGLIGGISSGVEGAIGTSAYVALTDGDKDVLSKKLETTKDLNDVELLKGKLFIPDNFCEIKEM